MRRRERLGFPLQRDGVMKFVYDAETRRAEEVGKVTIRSLRKERGWSAKDLAYILGVEPAILSQWEMRKTRPNPERLAELARRLEVPAERLFVKELKPAGRPRTR